MTRPDGTIRTRRHSLSRWWLAGLLIGCLLPIGLGQARTELVTDRLFRICFHTPAAIRAVSRRRAVQRRRGYPLRRLPTSLRRLIPPRLAAMHLLPMTADSDCLCRRGPPLVS
ncbi:hypothetical protein BH688_06140 [Kushneria phosphatilytica]|uniref:Uncharacterized protein n=1 Tax=Kushneria phosphatilytica TaxID=657387 RepID=A0A1S1NYD2_9GAMM|nr:hypothetical protein BH688_06140 [Kushneria phosphatilytica]QEL11417.1 hypothetical protein FY550_09880 [Kushneria phosphatilytica]